MVQVDQPRQKVYEALKDLDIEFQVYDHPPISHRGEAFHFPQAIEGGRCRNLFLRNSGGKNHYLVILELDVPLDLGILSQRLSEKRLGFASEERLMRVLGVLPGSVSPFNFLNGKGKDVFIIVDQALLRHEKLVFHPNENTASLVLSVKDFKKYLQTLGNRIEFLDLSR
ncbi:MAG: prolyl-tRNA synthetase associated domain-containing protein [Nitrospirae bacterium]|nr:prolyl-tRNA synthetase associated domain-containing protein [Nitrospirota bacterium]